MLKCLGRPPALRKQVILVSDPSYPHHPVGRALDIPRTWNVLNEIRTCFKKDQGGFFGETSIMRDVFFVKKTIDDFAVFDFCGS